MNSVAAVTFALVCSLASFAVSAAPSDPLEFYREYQTVLGKAKSLDPLLPYYTKDLSAGLAKMPKEMQANYLKMNSRKLSDLKVTRQTVDASKAVFEMTAKTEDGRPTSGKVTLVKERGAWKVDDDAWATQLPR
jgi:Domain of unknown function (DUF4878)